MVDTKISALPAAGSVVDANELAINEAGTSKKVTALQVRTHARAGSRILPTDTGTVNDWNPTGFSTATFIQWNGAADMALTGLTARPDGTEVLLLNSEDGAGSTKTITIYHEAAGSTDTNRFYFPGGATQRVLRPFEGVLMAYRSNRWALIERMPMETRYATGAFTIPTGNFRLHAKRLELISADRATIQGTARLVII